MTKEHDEQARHLMKLQALIVAYLKALYEQVQRAAADQVPHNWMARCVNLTSGMMILPRDARRFKARVYNTSTSISVYLSPEQFDLDSINDQFDRSNNSFIEAINLGPGDYIELETTGAIYACPTVASTSVTLNIVAPYFEDVIAKPPMYRLKPNVEEDKTVGNTWPEGYEDRHTNQVIV